MFTYLALALIIAQANGFIAVPTSVIVGGIIVWLVGFLVDLWTTLADKARRASEGLDPEPVKAPMAPRGFTLALITVCALGLVIPWYGIVWIVFVYVCYALQLLAFVLNANVNVNVNR